MESYFKLIPHLADTWIKAMSTRLIEVAKAWINDDSQRIEVGARCDWRSWAEFRQEMVVVFEPITEMEIARRQNIELRQTGCVSGYIQRLCTLRYKIPSIMEEEAH